MIRVIEAISFSMETINSFPESLGPLPHTSTCQARTATGPLLQIHHTLLEGKC